MKKKPSYKLSAEEEKMEVEMSQGEWKSLPKDQLEKLKGELVKAAKKQLKEARVNLRLNSMDVEKIRLKALQEGIPYQTLISSVIHKYATDQLVDRLSIQRVAQSMGIKR